MSPEEAAYAEALRRIREAEDTGATSLDFSGLDSLHQLPRELEHLTSLRTLNLSQCWQLSELGRLAGLSSLRTLDLSQCWQLSNLAPLSGLTSLQRLDLSKCLEIHDLRPLAGLTSLQRLTLSWCEQLTEFTLPTGLTSLQTLDLSACKQLDGDFSSLAGLRSLQTLDLSACKQLRELTLPSDLRSLQTLNLSACKQLSGDLGSLAGLKSLQTLDLSRCEQLEELILPTGLRSLQMLNLSGCEQLRELILPTGLRSLQTLNLAKCGRLRGDLRSLAGLKSLQTLDLSGCEQLRELILPTGLRSLQTLNLSRCGRLRELTLPPDLRSLQTLNLFGCGRVRGDFRPLAGLSALRLNLSGCEQLRDLRMLTALTALHKLDLSDCYRITDLRPLAELTSLQELDLHGPGPFSVGETQFSEGEPDFSKCMRLSDLAPLTGLTSLQSLDLHRCYRLSDLRPLAGLKSLQTLDLSWCGQLSDLRGLAGLKSLQTLDLSYCGQLSDLRGLAGLKSLQTLDLSYCERLSDLRGLAGLASLQTLGLSGCRQLSGDLRPLAGLASLQTLGLSGCRQLSDLSPLAGLASLQTLYLCYCEQLGDFRPLAGLTSLQTLDLSQCGQLSGDLSPLAALASLQTLDLSGCGQLHSDLGPLAGLTSLQTLNLSGCGQLRGDLGPLAGLASLRELNLSGCPGVRRFAPLESLLTTLQDLRLFGCELEDLPSEVCGEGSYENVLAKVRAHYKDLKSGQRRDAEVKVLFLGNGGTGKTQLCRRLRGEKFDPSVPTTHGIQLSDTSITLESFDNPVRLNLWDFGGQEIYHGSHALFLQGRAIFLVLWTPEREGQTSYQEGHLSLRHRPLTYWLDYLRAFAEVDSPVLLIQSQCDTPAERAALRQVDVDDFTALQRVQVSAKTGLGLDLMTAALKEAMRDCLYRRPPPPIGACRVRVRDRLRGWLAEDQMRPAAHRQHRLLERAEFDHLCDEEGGISDKDALLDFLHHNGVVFYRSGLFGGRIVLDQNWALEAIYTLFDRKKTLPLLRGYGHFTRADLEALIWSDFTPEEQKVFLSMMESCGICFPARELQGGEWEYIAPELLPGWSEAQEQLLGRLREDPPAAEAEAHYPFLHEGILRGYFSKIGQHAKDAPVYWKYGCWFYEKTTKSQVLIEGQWQDSKTETGPGTIRFRAWGERARQLLEPLLVELGRLPIGQPPQIKWQDDALATRRMPHAGDVDGTRETGLKDLEIPARPELPSAPGKPEVFVSYAWGDDSSQEARQRTDVVERLCQSLSQEGWKVLRDNEVMRRGDLISGFMKRIGRAGHVIVVLSDKYLQSTYCMTELYGIYQRSVGEKEDFLRRIIPLALADARFGTWRDRANHAKYWKKEFIEMKRHLSDLGVADFGLYKAMQDWYNHVSDILAHVNDVLHPQGFEAIVKDDFAALRQMLQRARSDLHA
jgi:internalin A